MKLRVIALSSIAGATLAGTAIAAAPKTHVMNVPLPDGSVARVEYVGDVAPKVTVAPAPLPGGFWSTGLFPSFAGFDRMFEQMDRQMHQIEQMARAPLSGAGNGLNVASYGSMPQGASSVTVVSVSNGSGTCTRTTETVAQGAGKPPKVTTKVSGDCGPARSQAPQSAPAAGPIDRT